jgi:hypothetical protein
VNKEFSKLVAHVAHFLKAIGDGYANGEHPHVEPEIRVSYNLEVEEAYIYVTPQSYGTGNGIESTFDYSIIDKLAQLSEKYRISYRIGQDEHRQLHFQIYV